MKNFIYFLLAMCIIACSDEAKIEDEIIGDWSYEREISLPYNPITDLDTVGNVTFLADGKGSWESSLASHDYELEWELKNGGKEITIKKTGFWAGNTVTYELVQKNENEFKLKGTIRKVFTTSTTLETVEHISIIRN